MEKIQFHHVDLASVAIPPIPCSFPLNTHPDYLRLKETADTWMLSHFASLYAADSRGPDYARQELLAKSQFGLFVCMTYANGIAQRVLLIMKFMNWFFLLDNVVDDCTSAAAVEDLSHKVVTVLEGNKAVIPSCCPASTRVILETAAEWWPEMCKDMPPKQQSRFIQALKDFFDSSVEQIFCQQGSLLPDVEAYMRLRLRTIAWYMASVLIEYSVGMELDEETCKNPLIRALQDATSYHISLVNDLTSFRKEFRDGCYVNVVALLYSNSESDLQDVLQQVCKMVQNKDEECAKLMSHMKTTELMEKPGMHSYLEGVSNWVSGSLQWHLMSARYKQV